MDYLREGIHLRGFAQIEPAGRLQERGLRAVPRPDEQRLGRLRPAHLPRRGHVHDENGEPPPPPRSRPQPGVAARRRAVGRVSYSGGAMQCQGALAMAAAAGAKPTRRLRRGARAAEPVQQRRSTRPSRSGATTRAGADRARSSRSATAPEPPRRALGLASGGAPARCDHVLDADLAGLRTAGRSSARCTSWPGGRCGRRRRRGCLGRALDLDVLVGVAVRRRRAR